ncbi:hypothetical protein PLANPX_1119 [Lacipirellula parvula]|uniref:Uncharacterized protein n=1 Tax=Lacipirellula parvula TaxID=2650471 RepID=A0A5K7X6N5_9BACT|nr:hypothetical protein PLANPX_1119 [Lacipirellula parvula]
MRGRYLGVDADGGDLKFACFVIWGSLYSSSVLQHLWGMRGHGTEHGGSYWRAFALRAVFFGAVGNWRPSDTADCARAQPALLPGLGGGFLSLSRCC